MSTTNRKISVSLDLKNYNKAMATFKKTTRDSFSQINKSLLNTNRQTSKQLQNSKKMMERNMNTLSSNMKKITNEQQKIAKSNSKVIKEQDKAIKQAFKTLDKHSKKTIEDVGDTTNKMSKSLSNSFFDMEKSVIGASRSFDDLNATNGLDQFSSKVSGGANDISNSLNSLEDETNHTLDNILNAFEYFGDKTKETMSLTAKGVEKSTQSITLSLKGLNKVGDSLESKSNSMAQRMIKGSSGVNNQLNNITKGIENLQKKTISAKSVLKFDVISGMFKKSMDTISNTTQTAISRIDTLANATDSFLNMGFKENEVERAIDTLDKGLRGLPTPINDAIKQTQNLGASFNDLDLASETFLALNDAILGFGGSTDQVNRVINDLGNSFNKGVIDGTSWNSMITNGMAPTLRGIADLMGITMDELREGLRSGTISVEDEFIPALLKLDKEGTETLESLQKIAKDSTRGIQTSFANMRTAITRGNAELIKSFNVTLEAFTGKDIGGLAVAYGSFVENSLKGIASTITDVSPKLADRVKGDMGVVVDSTGTLAQSEEHLNHFANVYELSLDRLKNASGKDIAKGVGLLVGAFAQLNAVTKFNKLSIQNKMMDKLTGSIMQTTSSVKELNGVFNSTFGESIKLVDSLQNSILSKFGNIGKVASKYSSSFLKTMESTMGEFIKLATTTFSTTGNIVAIALHKSMKSITPMMLFGSILVAIGSLPLLLGDELTQAIMLAFDDMVDKIPQVTDKILNTLIPNFERMGQLGANVFVDGLSSINKTLPDLLSSINGMFKTIMSVFIDNETEIIRTVGETIAILFMSLGDLFLNTDDGLLKQAMIGLNKIVDLFYDITPSLGSEIGLAIGSMFEIAINHIPRMLGGLVDGVINTLYTLFDPQNGVMSKFGDLMMLSVYAMFNGLIDNRDKFMAIIFEFTTGIINAFMMTSRELFSGLATFFEGSFVPLAIEIGKTVTNAIGDFVLLVSDNLYGIVTPLTQVFFTVGGSLLMNITKALPSLITALGETISDMLDFLLDNAFTGIDSFGVQLTMQIINTIGTLVNTLIKLAPKVIEVMFAIIESIGIGILRSVDGRIGDLALGLIRAIVDVVVIVAKNVPTILALIGDIIHELIVGIGNFLGDSNNVGYILDMIFYTITNIILGLAEAIPEIVNVLVEVLSGLGEVITRLFIALLMNIPKIVQGLVKVIFAIVQGVISSIFGIFTRPFGRKKTQNDFLKEYESNANSQREERRQRIIDGNYSFGSSYATQSPYATGGVDRRDMERTIRNENMIEPKIYVNNEIVGDKIQTDVNFRNTTDSSVDSYTF